MRKTQNDGLELYRLIEERAKVNSAVTSLRGHDVQTIRNHLEIISQSNSIVNAVSRVLAEFQLDNDCGNELPDSIKNGNVQQSICRKSLRISPTNNAKIK